MIQAAILGCGTIGSGVYEVIERNQEQIQKKEENRNSYMDEI